MQKSTATYIVANHAPPNLKEIVKLEEITTCDDTCHGSSGGHNICGHSSHAIPLNMS